MTDQEKQEFRTAIIDDIRGIIVEFAEEARASFERVNKEAAQLENTLTRVEVLQQEESIKNKELFGEVLSKLNKVEESLPTTIQKIQSLEREIVLLKMAVFGKESVVGQL